MLILVLLPLFSGEADIDDDVIENSAFLFLLLFELMSMMVLPIILEGDRLIISHKDSLTLFLSLHVWYSIIIILSLSHSHPSLALINNPANHYNTLQKWQWHKNINLLKVLFLTHYFIILLFEYYVTIRNFDTYNIQNPHFSNFGG